MKCKLLMNTPYFLIIMSAVMSRLSHWFLTILHQSSNEKCFSVCFTFSIHHNPYIHNFLIWEFTAIYELFFCYPTPLETRMLVEKKTQPGGERTLPFFIKRKRLRLHPAAEKPPNPGPCQRGPSLAASTARGFFYPRAEIRPSWDSNSRPCGSDATGLG